MVREIYEIDAVTRNVVAIYGSFEEAGKASGMPPNRVKDACSRKRFQRGGRSFFRYADCYIRDEEWSKACDCPVYCTDGTRLRIFYDRAEAARAVAVSDNTMNSYIFKGVGKGLRWGRCRRGRDHLVEELRKEASNG